jgi:tripartite-type tricarboxylate transporter receptor subunit TctC
MKLPRRKFLHLAAGTVALPAVSRIELAQADYPTRPITMIVPTPPGGITDVLGRIMADRMKRSLGQPIIIENVSGADGSIGVGRAARARPDGYTINIGFKGSHVLNGAFYSLSYDVLKDFAPISALVTLPNILFTRKTIPAADVIELITWLKNNSDKATAGVVSAGLRLSTAFFQRETGTQFTLVPYRSNALAMQDMVAGRIDLLYSTPDQLPRMRAGGVKAYAVTSDKRLEVAPDIPTFSEMGLPSLSFYTWIALFAPKGTPSVVVSKLNAAAADTLADPAVQSRIADFGLGIFPRDRQTPEALAAMQKADAEKWWPIIKEFGIKAE